MEDLSYFHLVWNLPAHWNIFIHLLDLQVSAQVTSAYKKASSVACDRHQESQQFGRDVCKANHHSLWLAIRIAGRLARVRPSRHNGDILCVLEIAVAPDCEISLRTGIGGFPEPFRHEPHTCARPWSCKTCFWIGPVLCWCPLSVFRALSSCLSLFHQLLLLFDLLTYTLSWSCNCAAISDRSPRRKNINLIMVELTFVNVNHPVQLRDPKHRRQIRSHISKVQHEQKRSAIDQAVGKLRLDAHDLDVHDFDITRLEDDDDDIAVCQPSGVVVSISETRPITQGEDLFYTTTTAAAARNPSHPRHRAPIPSSSSIIYTPQDETQYVRNAPIRAPPVSPGIHHSLTDTTDELQIFARHAEMSVPSMLVRLRHPRAKATPKKPANVQMTPTVSRPRHHLPSRHRARTAALIA